MVSFQTAIALCAIASAAAANIEQGQAKDVLWPRLRHASFVANSLPKHKRATHVTTPAPKETSPSMDSDVASTAAAPTVVPKEAASTMAVVQLGRELAEMKESHAHVAQLEQTLAADVQLLRESTMLQRVSTSRRGRAAAHKQVRESERLVKDTEAMVKESRESAMENSRVALREAQEVRAAADALSAEAEEQLQMMTATPKDHKKPKLTKSSKHSTPPPVLKTPTTTQAVTASAATDSSNSLDDSDMDDTNDLADDVSSDAS
mmetsp:Transcript_4092/g.7041  ORF Transcript_4092/g.7041 Transcript_4092/m.7041 type:complete len:263 (-) Transcript_4092:61-849(-)